MNEIICECGHSINKHYLDRPSYGDAVGYCTHYDENNHVFCSCQKSPSNIAAQDLARITADNIALREIARAVTLLDDGTGMRTFPSKSLIEKARAALKE